MFSAIQIQDDADVEYSLRSAAEAGFRYVSMGFGSSKCFHSEDWENHIGWLNTLLREDGLECYQTHLPYYDLRIDSAIKDEAMELAMKRCITATAMLGGKVTAFHPRSAVDRNYSVRTSAEDNRRVLEEYLPVAEKAGICIAIENLPIFPECSLWRFYSSNYEDIIELADSFNTPNIGICWDTGHATLTGLNQVIALRAVGKRLVCTHIHSNYGLKDEHLNPYYGKTDWKSLMPILSEIGYTGPMTLELDYYASPLLKSFFTFGYDAVNYLIELSEKQ